MFFYVFFFSEWKKRFNRFGCMFLAFRDENPNVTLFFYLFRMFTAHNESMFLFILFYFFLVNFNILDICILCCHHGHKFLWFFFSWIDYLLLLWIQFSVYDIGTSRTVRFVMIECIWKDFSCWNCVT